MQRYGSLALAWLLIGAAHSYAGEAVRGGEITLLRGAATVTQAGQSLRLFPGASVLVGDQLRTGQGARLKLRMVDGTEISLGENTEFVVREYETGEGFGRAALELTKGFFRAVTGKITKLSDNSFEVKTPLATIGVRGTEFWGEQRPRKLRVAMLGGTAVIITNAAGSVELTEPGVGTEVTDPNQPPRAPFRWSPEELNRAAGTVD